MSSFWWRQECFEVTAGLLWYSSSVNTWQEVQGRWLAYHISHAGEMCCMSLIISPDHSCAVMNCLYFAERLILQIPGHVQLARNSVSAYAQRALCLRTACLAVTWRKLARKHLNNKYSRWIDKQEFYKTDTWTYSQAYFDVPVQHIVKYQRTNWIFVYYPNHHDWIMHKFFERPN